MERFLYLGRFQPLHKGHHHVVSSLKEDNSLVVGIGSSDRHHEQKNPLNFFERYRVLKNCFPELEIIAVPDRETDPVWTRQILDKVEIDRVVSGEGVTRKCFQEEDITVDHPDYLDRDRFRSTRIREKIRNGEDWKELVPECSLEVLEDIGFERRIRER